MMPITFNPDRAAYLLWCPAGKEPFAPQGPATDFDRDFHGDVVEQFVHAMRAPSE